MSGKTLAQIWYETANTSPQDIFGSKHTYVTDDRAQPGYIGQKFDNHRVLLIGMNPAGDGTGAQNGLVYTALDELDGKEPSVAELSRVIASVMPSWPIFMNCIQPILTRLGLTVHDIALINLLPWRSDSPHVLYEMSWRKIVNRQVDALAPARIIALGSKTSGTGYYVDKYYTGPAPVQAVRRSIGDRRISAETAEDVANLTR